MSLIFFIDNVNDNFSVRFIKKGFIKINCIVREVLYGGNFIIMFFWLIKLVVFINVCYN